MDNRPDNVREEDKPQSGAGKSVDTDVNADAAEVGASPKSAPDLGYKNGKEIAKSGLLGLFIGLAIIVPGVSGSTVAIIFKLYDKLIYAFGLSLIHI